MSHFKKTEFNVRNDLSPQNEMNVSTLKDEKVVVIKDFQMPPIQEKGAGDYQAIKKKYGPLAVTDPERSARKVKDRRFSLNPLLRDPLAIEQEERRAIEEKVRARVEALAADAKAVAMHEGYQEGLKKGHEEAFKKLIEEKRGSLDNFDKMVQEAERAKDEIYRANERFLIQLVFRIARMIILKEATTDREFVTRLATELISRVGVKDNIKLRINSEDAETLALLKGGLEKAFGKMNNLNIESSPKVQPGGCQIETEWNAIDATLEKALQGVHESLFGKSGSGDA